MVNSQQDNKTTRVCLSLFYLACRIRFMGRTSLVSPRLHLASKFFYEIIVSYPDLVVGD